MNCLSGVVVDTFDELVSSITHVVNQFLNRKCPKILDEYFASAPLTLLVKSGGGIRPIVVGTVWRCLVSKVSVVVIGHSSDGYLNDLQYGVGVSGRGEAILHHIVTAYGPGFGKMGVKACHLFAFGGLGIYCAGDVLNYAFLASRLQSASLWTKLLRHSGPVASDLPLKMPYSFVEISNVRTYHCVLCYQLGFPLFPILKLCSTCSKFFRKIFIETMMYRVLILVGKEVDIKLSDGVDKPLRPADMLLYSWDEDLDVCVDLTGSSPLIDATQRKRVKYEAKCSKIGYGFLPSYSLLWGIIEGCNDLIEVDSKILCGLRPCG
ncbi:hypothetical protein Tco_1112680, partial [Tanacetum coccineum]